MTYFIFLIFGDIMKIFCAYFVTIIRAEKSDYNWLLLAI